VEKDFADGILAAEIVRFYYPDIVDFRMLRPALSVSERTEQWKLINSEIFVHIGLTVPSHVLSQLSISKSGIAQSFLFNLRMSLALTGAQTNLFPPPQFLQDPRLNGLAYPIHQQATINPYHHMYNPLWALNKGQLPFFDETGKVKSPNNGPATNRGQQMVSPSSKSITNDKTASKGAGKQVTNGAPKEPFVPYPVANASVSLNQAKNELNEKTKKLQDKEDEGGEKKAFEKNWLII